MPFLKSHALGNDYIALEEGVVPLVPPAVRLLCDRHHGIGSDGVLVRVESPRADFGLRIFNPDGSEAERSGNGLRIFAGYLLELGRVIEGRAFTVETQAGVVTMTVLGRSDDGVVRVEVEMGRASFRSSAVGLPGPDRDVDGEVIEPESGEPVEINTVSIGNPHCVIFDDDLDPDDLRERAPDIANHPWFARGTNVQFARVAGPGAMDAWVWERGAGETLASGTSACAVAAVAVRRGLVTEREIAVHMPGGTLHVTVASDWTLTLRGPVESVYRGELSPGLRARLATLGATS